MAVFWPSSNTWPLLSAAFRDLSPTAVYSWSPVTLGLFCAVSNTGQSLPATENSAYQKKIKVNHGQRATAAYLGGRVVRGSALNLTGEFRQRRHRVASRERNSVCGNAKNGRRGVCEIPRGPGVAFNAFISRSFRERKREKAGNPTRLSVRAAVGG